MSYVFKEFPKMLYPVPGHPGIVVRNQEEETAVLAAHAPAKPPEKPSIPVPDAEPKAEPKPHEKPHGKKAGRK